MKELSRVLIFGRLGMKEGAAQGADPGPSRDEGKELCGADPGPSRDEGKSCPWC